MSTSPAPSSPAPLRRLSRPAANPLPSLCSARPGAAVGPARSPADGLPVGSLAQLLVGHLIPDGETVLLLVKPSWWTLVYHVFRIAVVCAICSIGVTLYKDSVPVQPSVVYQASIMIVFLQLLWGLAVWMSRFYLLTDRRVMLLAGVFRVQVSDVPLLEIARTRLLQQLHERPLLTGNIEIIPRDEQAPIMLWQHVGNARFVQAQIVAAMHRARQQSRG